MPNAKEVDVANAIAVYLNSQTLSMTFTAKLDYLPDFEREDLDSAEITIFPAGKQISFASRSDNQYLYNINIVIRIPVKAAKEPDLADEMYFSEQVIESLDRIRMSNTSFRGAETSQSYDLELLNERNEFLVAYSLTYFEIK